MRDLQAIALSLLLLSPTTGLARIIGEPPDGTWHLLTGPGSKPIGRTFGIQAHHPEGKRVILFGGYDGNTPLVDLWEGVAATRIVWNDVSSEGPPPPPNFLSAQIWDPRNDQLVAFGELYGPGSDYPTAVYTLELVGRHRWSRREPVGEGPSARSEHTAVYDPLRRRMVVFGGSSPGGMPNDVWALSLDGEMEWTRLEPEGTPPIGRWGHTATYDPVRDRMIVIGGQNSRAVPSPYLLGDVWALEFSPQLRWQRLNPQGLGPDVLHAHGAAYDPIGNRILVTGGLRSDLRESAAVWELLLEGEPEWRLLVPGGPPPTARVYPMTMFDARHDRLVVMFGMSRGQALDDLWALDFKRRSGFDEVVAADQRPADPATRRARPQPTAEKDDAHPWVDGGSRLLTILGVYPNPARGMIQLSCVLPRSSSAGSIELLDAAGRVVHREALGPGSGETITVSVRPRIPLKPGCYYLRIRQENSADSRRVVLID